jgi:RNA polymerase sigma-70 factor (ECF subfamily)
MTDWSQILKEHGGIVWETVSRLVTENADAADCFQETFIAAFKFSRNQHVRNWPGLLKRLATSRALDHLRKRRRNSALSLSAGDSCELEGRIRRPPAVAEERELFDRLRDGLASLPPDQAEACCMRFLEDFSYEQIADELGVTVNHVGVLLHRARRDLQKQLAAFSPSPAKPNGSQVGI